MSKKALIWDLDGTLLDSYPIYISSLREAMEELGVSVAEGEILRDVLTYTIGHFIKRMAKEYQLSEETIESSYLQRGMSRNLLIPPMQHAKELLQILRDMGVLNLVYTHKDQSALDVLKEIGLLPFFTDVLTGDSGFRRKPAPDAVNYLLEKYQLNKEDTYYVGDRCIDVDCGWNAGIKSILFLPEGSCVVPNGHETHIVKDLLEIAEIVKNA